MDKRSLRRLVEQTLRERGEIVTAQLAAEVGVDAKRVGHACRYLVGIGIARRARQGRYVASQITSDAQGATCDSRQDLVGKATILFRDQDDSGDARRDDTQQPEQGRSTYSTTFEFNGNRCRVELDLQASSIAKFSDPWDVLDAWVSEFVLSGSIGTEEASQMLHRFADDVKDIGEL